MQQEKTGTLNGQTVAQLRQVVDVMTSTPAGPDLGIAQALAHVANVFSTHSFHEAATVLAQAADILPVHAKSMASNTTKLTQAADVISAPADGLRRRGSR